MKEHRHAAIMFTDIVGYTALMSSDEDQAFELLRKNREIHKRLIKKYDGKLIKEMGDGMLISFKLASACVRCALAMKSEAINQNIPLKIGIHQGEILYDGNDVFGDGVNVAARLQEYADEKGIVISGTIYQDIKNKKDIKTRYIEEVTLKNVPEPVKIYYASSIGPPDLEYTFGEVDHTADRRWPVFKPSFLRISFIAVPLVAIIIFFLFYGGTSLPFNERDWILISDFENQTGDPVFDHSLNTAFMLSINQSRYINVLSRQQMTDALKRMRKVIEDRIDPGTAREIAVRNGIRIFILPGISKIGEQYILTAEIQETHTGEMLKSAVIYADDKEDIIPKLDKLSKTIRRNLGESRFRIYQESKPLPVVTTHSLDALKQYALGLEKHKNLQFDEAVIHYEEAIHLDSNFTAAKASLGNLLVERFDREEGIHWLNSAIRSIDDLTDREKYGILSFYAANVENDLAKSIEYTRTRIELYPDDPVGYNNLGWYFQQQGQYAKSVEAYKDALRIDPHMTLANGGLNWVYMDYLGEMDSLYVWSKHMIANSPENSWAYMYLGSAFAGLDSLRQAESSFRKAREIDPDFLIAGYRLAHVDRLMGKYDYAIDVLEDILEKNPEESSAHYDIAINYELMGNQEMSRSHFQEFRNIAEKWPEEYPENPLSYISLGVVMTRLGDLRKGMEIGNRALDVDSTAHFLYSQLLAVQGKKTESLNHLEKSLENGYRNLVWIKLHPDLQSLHDDPRFRKLLGKYFNVK